MFRDVLVVLFLASALFFPCKMSRLICTAATKGQTRLSLSAALTQCWPVLQLLQRLNQINVML